MQLPRPHIKTLYNGINISADISRSLINFTYTDNLDEADTLDIELEDAFQKWQNRWYPEKGAKIQAEIGIEGGVILDCGTFEIDEIEFTGPPDSINLRCIAAGFKEGQKRTAKSHVHENKTLAEIVKTVADAAGLKVMGKVSGIRIGRIVQQKERDLRFLKRLATEYGYSFNVRDKTAVFIRKEELENAKAVAAYDKTELLGFSIRDKSSGTYKLASVKWHNPETGQLVSHKTDEGGANNTDDILELKLTAQSEAQAIEMTKAALRAANNLQQSGAVSLPGSPLLCSGSVIELWNLGLLSGDYIIRQSAHSISNDAGWVVDAEVYKINYKEDAKEKAKPKPKARSDINANLDLFSGKPLPPGEFNDYSENDDSDA